MTRAIDRLGGGMPGWAAVLIVYAASRIVSTALLLGMFLLATNEGWTFASHRDNPTFFTFSGSWDSSFYRGIALQGYPTELPVDSRGNVLPNPWAFLPVFPWVTRGLMAISGLDFYVAGVIVSTVFGAAAAIVLYRLLLLRTNERSALWAVILFCFGPVSFILQTAYAESLFLFLIFASLLALVARRYLVMIPAGVLAAFTRPGALALALVLAIHLIVRMRTGLLRRGEAATIVLAGLVIAAAGLAWPVIADQVTGHPNAYLQTELSWWVGFVGRQHFAPLTPWFLMAGRYLGIAGLLLVVAVVGGYAWWLSRRALRGLGHEFVAWGASYGLYLFAVFLPQQSLFRMLMPLAPLLGDPAFSRSAAVRRTLLVVGIVLQGAAVVLLWFLGYP
ncbi:MAG: hypothetical protein JWP19_1692 [Rhodoglobus sp.]|nr:hypothetical protein [Rhodoglobus sp.]